MAKIELSPVVINRLEAIREYISFELASPAAAQNTIDMILLTFERLENFPDSYPLSSALYNKVPDQFSTTRFLVCGHNIALYDHDDETVQILQIYHGSEEYIHHLFHR
ncbi:MAG: type II toxin-antitoxin system RelE/ParE family toxin [Eubacteriales bacterium]|nr:type II toxin-antitoxin system RelE/ParE family toxin [Eubacteriales bacterium]